MLPVLSFNKITRQTVTFLISVFLWQSSPLVSPKGCINFIIVAHKFWCRIPRISWLHFRIVMSVASYVLFVLFWWNLFAFLSC